MNHLAHLLIADTAGGSRIGALLGDFVKGDPAAHYHGAWLAGIHLHRAVDSFTDAHPLHRHSRKRFQPGLRRYAGVLVDLYYDHFLARRWEEFHPLPLETFTEAVHTEIAAARDRLPEPLQRFAEVMTTQNLLCRYRDREVIIDVGRRMATRLSRPNRLAEAAPELLRFYTGVEADFATFFPELMRFARQWSA